MNDMKLIVNLLSLIRNAEKTGTFFPAYFSPDSIGCPQAEIDNMAIKLQHEGLVDGLKTTEQIDNAPPAVLWNLSSPAVTIKGITFMAENNAFAKTVESMKTTAVSAAVQGARAAIFNYLTGG